VHTAAAQDPAGFPSVLSYRTVKVADGVYAFITPEERTGFQSGNSIAVIGDDGVLVFDTGNIPASTRRQIAEIRALTGKPVRYVVNSHWHPDHNLGNAEYRKAFPGVTIIGTGGTRRGVADRLAGYQAQMKGYGPTDSVMLLRLATGKMRDGSAMPENVRIMWSLVTRDYAEFLPEVMSATPLPPELTFEDSLTVHLGAREVRFVHPGRANTEGDVYAYIPDVNVLLTGDLVTQPCPFPSTAFFGGWIKALDALKAVGAATLVPGHGDVMHDYRYVELVRGLLAWTKAEAMTAARAGVPLDSLQAHLDFAEWETRFGRGDIVRTNAFNSFYRYPGLERAYDEARYEAQTQIPKEKR